MLANVNGDGHGLNMFIVLIALENECVFSIKASIELERSGWGPEGCELWHC